MLKKLIVMSLSALLLTGCGGAPKEETVHTPEYLSITEVSVSIGDETIVYTAMNNEAVKSYSDKQFVVYPDKTLFDTVQVDFVQGNSLNNYIQAYYLSLIHIWAKMHNRKPVVIRSPLKCKNPCCAKCYGLDPSTGRPVKVGAPVGYTAGQSLAEQCTQTKMCIRDSRWR